MVTTIRKVTGGDYPFYEFACLSTDTKPTSLVPENSICHEIDTGKHFYFGNKAWHELPPKGGSGGGEGGGGAVEPFFVVAAVNDDTVTFDKTFAQTKAAIQAGQDVYLTFGGLSYPLYRFAADNDAFAAWIVGDVDERQEIDMAEENGETVGWISNVSSGGGAEKFVVTLIESNDTWTADKTIAEIIEAYEANQVVVAKYPVDSLYVELPISTADSNGGMSAAIFAGLDDRDQGAPSIITVMCVNQGSGDVIQTETTPIPTSTNAPLIVTMTADGSTGRMVGDKTFAEVFAAMSAGKTVTCVAPNVGAARIIDASQVDVQGETSVIVTHSKIMDDGTASLNVIAGSPNEHLYVTLS